MLRVVFMGTPDFSVPALHKLRQSEQVAGVFTQPDRPAGRGRHITWSPVKRAALEAGLPVYQPKSLRTDESADLVKKLQPEVIVVAAYGLILPQSVLDIPRHGCINLHPSLLPKFRGPSPVASAILAGEVETGVTIMLMDAGMDTGPILVQRTVSIDSAETTSTLERRLGLIGADLIMETLPQWVAGKITPRLQDESRATVTSRIRKEDGLIDWSLTASEIVRRVRAYHPWPSAYTYFHGAVLKVLEAEDCGASGPAGIVFVEGNSVVVGSGQGSLRLIRVQPAGRRVMSAEEYVRGHPVFVGADLTGKGTMIAPNEADP